jgi:LysM repeat protein
MQSLLQMGLGEPLLRAATHIFSLVAIVTVIWLAQSYFRQPLAQAGGNPQPPQGPTPLPAAPLAVASAPQDVSSFGIVRQTDPHTNIPARPRQDVVKYTVVAGDTVSGIADRYGLQPSTVFAANYYVLLDDPHNLRPGQVLNILPVDGVYREWQAGEGINLVARFYHVKPDDIVNFPANHLSPATVGD